MNKRLLVNKMANSNDGSLLLSEQFTQLTVDVLLGFLQNNDPANLPTSVSKPKAGEVFAIRVASGREDWRCDGYRWKQNGSSHLPRNDPKIQKLHFALRQKEGLSNKFQKFAYKSLHRSDIVVIHYIGDDKQALDFPHAVKGVFIVAAKRTPFGTYGGKLMNFSATDLQEIAFKAALSAGQIKPEWVNSVVVGNVFHATKDGAYVSRHCGLRVGIPIPVPALSVNRMCGSGFQSVVSGAQEILLHDSEIVLTGGTENMSLAPHAVRGIRFGVRLGQDVVMEDTLWQGLIDTHIKMPMGITAENLAEKYGITRQQCDEFAVRSNQRWKAANDAGYFNQEIAPIKIKTKKGEVEMVADEHPKPETTVESLAKLAPVFKKNGTVDAGNASGISDGAGCIILASEAAVARHNLNPLARLAGYSIAGCDPTIMGIGPVPAIHALLKTTNHKLEDVDLFEVNEAFAPQTLAVMKDLGLDPEKTNVNGGAIAIGHPVGASGSRITAHLTYELARRNGKLAIGTACCGGGQGIALLLESV